MNKIINILLLFFSVLVIAQVPNKMSYQAVIRDASNNLLANTSIGTKVSILQGSSTGTVVYSETHTTSTNTNGLVTLEIGAGTVVLGTFSSVDWSTGNYYIKTETDPTGGSNYTISGTSQLLSVPYALYANSSGNVSNSAAINYVGTSYLGQTSGAGSTGTSEGTSSNSALTAIGTNSLNANTTGINNNGIGYFTLKNNTTGSYNNALGSSTLQNNTTGDSNNAFGDGAMETNTSGSENVAFGDYALRRNTIAGNNVAIGSSALEDNVDGSQNTAVGSIALRANTSGYNNTAVGRQALNKNTTGINTTAIGHSAGYNSNGTGNIFIGYNSGYNETGNDKLYIDNSNTNTPLVYGDFSTNTLTINDNLVASTIKLTNGASDGYILQSDSTGSGTWVNPSTITSTSALRYVGSSYLGQTSGNGATGTSEGTTSNNELIAIGNDALLNNTSGKNNLAIGGYSLESNTTGEYNIGLGQSALNTNTSGTNNVAIGKWAGYNNTTGSSNTFLGHLTNASINNLTNATAIGANAVVSSSNSLILGNNANVGIGTSSPTEKLEVSGKTKTTNLQISNGASNGYVLQSDASGNGTWVNSTTLSNGNWTTSGTNQYSALTGNVGIGTTSPSTLFHVESSNTTVMTLNQTGTTLRYTGQVLKRDGSERWFVGMNSTDDDFIIRQNSSTDAVTINTTSGNVGIGTTSPTEKLEISGSAKITSGTIEFSNTAQSTYIGADAGAADSLSGSTRNTGIGYKALNTNTTGSGNVGVGVNSLEVNTTGNSNVAVGYNALSDNTIGNWNTSIGQQSLTNNTTGNYNIGIGGQALGNNISGANNVALGYGAGLMAAGSGNIFIGYQAGANEFGSNSLYIDNSNTTSPLIWGDFSSNYVNINGNLGIGTSAPSNKLDIQSTSSVTANVQSSGSSAYYQADASSGQEAAFLFNTYSSGSNLKRWAFGKSTAAESGSDVGSNFFINRYDDNGSYLGQPLAITRSTGQVVIGQSQPDSSESTLKLNGSMQVKVLTIASSNVSTTLNGDDYMVVYNGTFSGNSIILPTASSYVGRIYMIVNHSSNAVTISSYVTANNTTNNSIAAGSTIQLVSDGTYWHKIN